ncbi:MAG: NAD(P)/FAD-dependent oxidoreductase [Gammaproteobacteria bacterium]|nr:NAD(P)/FAD-dependent oxidoreductase [Gammaproteobacteria bacterium]MBI5616281.1 NAD(P)/FAD-dependent oxidoreductase [Gammaproteobacteria bacterium]
MANKKRVVVIGAGAAGLSVAARLQRGGQGLEVVLVDPASVHYYQPLWTLVGAGIFPKERSRRPMAEMIPKGVQWIRQAAAEFRPEENCVVTADGQRLGYDALVVAAGLQINWGKIPGLQEAVGKNGVCSNYSYDTVNATWEQIQRFTGGRALFTIPSTPIKCAGAPLKVMFLAEDHFRRTGIRNVTHVSYMCAVASIFRAPKYAERLSAIATARGIEVNYRQELTELRPEAKEAVFKHAESGEERVEKYDLIHVTPPMGPPDFIKQSTLGDAAGWVEVNKATMQHVRYPNVFSLGDASNLPTSKTAAAIRAQSPILVANLLAFLRGTTSDAQYYGYTSCPLVTGYGKLMLAEFDYELKPVETFPFDQGEERGSMYLLKKYVMPEIYWRGLVRGRSWPWPLP